MADLARALGGALPQRPVVRAAVVATSPAELAERLGALLACVPGPRIDPEAGVFAGHDEVEPRIGFLFTGQGAPARADGGLWARRFGFARDLYRAARLDERGDPMSTAAAQPAIVTASLAGLRALASLGIAAEVAVGHSLGELAAWHWAGALDAEALLRLATERGRAMARLATPAGAMASLGAAPDQAEALIA